MTCTSTALLLLLAMASLLVSGICAAVSDRPAGRGARAQPPPPPLSASGLPLEVEAHFNMTQHMKGLADDTPTIGPGLPPMRFSWSTQFDCALMVPGFDANALRKAREERAEQMPLMSGATKGTPYRDAKTQEAAVKDFLNHTTYWTSIGAGLYGPKWDDNFEYMVLLNPVLNRRQISVDRRDVRQEWLSDDVIQIYTKDYLTIQEIGAVNGKPPRYKEVITENTEAYWFEPCGLRVVYLWSDFRNFSAVALESVTVTPDDICGAASQICTGDLFPFDNMTDCLTFMRSLPYACEDGNHAVQDDTLVCRRVHVLGAQVAPIVHCPHIARISEFCYPGLCENGSLGKTWLEMHPPMAPWDSQGADFVDAWCGIWAWLTPTLMVLLAAGACAVHKRHIKRLSGGSKVGVLAMSSSMRLGSLRIRGPPAAATHHVTSEPFMESVSFRNTFKSTFERPANDTALHFLFSDVTYEVSGKRIFSGMYGHLRPGEMSAILGPSGAGKTTLMMLLAGRVDRGGARRLCGTVVRYTGNEKTGKLVRDERWTRYNSGFVEQEDRLPLTLTAAECLYLEACLLLPAGEDRAARVEATLTDMGIRHVRGSRLGNCSGGERRRMTIALQLINRPGTLFLDEPTSGLDASSALMLMERLNLLAVSGVTVVTTLHQPRTKIFCMIDSLVLVGRGGLPIFSGPPDNLIHALASWEQSHLEGRVRTRSDADLPLPPSVIEEVERIFHMLQSAAYHETLTPSLLVKELQAASYSNQVSESDILGALGLPVGGGAGSAAVEFGTVLAWVGGWASLVGDCTKLTRLSEFLDLCLKALPGLKEQQADGVTTAGVRVVMGGEEVSSGSVGSSTGGDSRNCANNGRASTSEQLALSAAEVLRFVSPTAADKRGHYALLWLLRHEARDLEEGWTATIHNRTQAFSSLLLNPADTISDLMNETTSVPMLSDVTFASLRDEMASETQAAAAAAAKEVQGLSVVKASAAGTTNSLCPSLPKRVAIRLYRMHCANHLLALYSPAFTGITMALLLLSVFARNATWHIQITYMFASGLLVGTLALFNLVYFQVSVPLLGASMEKVDMRAELSAGRASVWEWWLYLVMRDTWLVSAAVIPFFAIFYYSVGYDFTPVRAWNSLLAIVLACEACVALGTAIYLALPLVTISHALVGVFTLYNALFSGVLVRTRDLFVIWRAWAPYTNPTYYVINVWMQSLLRANILQCEPRAYPAVCNPIGDQTLIDVGFDSITVQASLLVLWGMAAGMWLIVLAIIATKQRVPVPEKVASLDQLSSAAAAGISKMYSRRMIVSARTASTPQSAGPSALLNPYGHHLTTMRSMRKGVADALQHMK